MESQTVISVEAVYEAGVLRPAEPLPLHPQDRVIIRVEVPGSRVTWPSNVADLYRELETEDRELTAQMWKASRPTWPSGDES